MKRYRVQELTAQILVYLVDHGEGSPYDISKAVGAQYASVYRAMERMRQRNILTARTHRSEKNRLKRFYKLTDSDEAENMVNRAIDIVARRVDYNTQMVGGN